MRIASELTSVVSASVIVPCALNICNFSGQCQRQSVSCWCRMESWSSRCMTCWKMNRCKFLFFIRCFIFILLGYFVPAIYK